MLFKIKCEQIYFAKKKYATLLKYGKNNTKQLKII